METKNNIIMRDGAVITEKRGRNSWGYFFGGEFIFGTEDRWTKADLQRLYDVGYFGKEDV